MSKAIVADSAVVLNFTIKLEDGSIAESSFNYGKPAAFVLGDGSMSEGFESCLIGLAPGDNRSFTLSPEQGFGQSNPDNIKHMDRSRFDDDAPAEVGMILAFTQRDGQEVPGIVRDVVGDSVTVDFNHPLAGQSVTFDVEIIEVK
ncbi:FKBP-type peptidyl-prolyl cis-trans isomerase [Alginatibacterium sediminis]|uniref:Peptidyl-prolyl cis-trans isomerase n=1 Tax=Alginatibacterium sediminis TaxID=2164068 RepID=A0A420EJM0_9ALTE|nr:FKBP-type peptidyl-prolyl cis-trans isomerase [Alginatibacterium sediminis]RKF20921.1 FKBP-type peptidyl-prolyl cis-trans isomerase [Alginatibacterium sediminis]